MSFSLVENPQFREFVRLLNPAYKVPSRETIRGPVLNDIFKEVHGAMQNELNGSVGVLLQDGWSTHQNDSVIAHCIKSGGNTHLLSTSQPSLESANVDYCFQEITKAMDKAEKDFNCKIIGVATDNCSTMGALRQKIKESYPKIEVIGCNSHLLNLCGSYFTPTAIREKVNDVQVFMKNHHYTIAALKERKANLPVLPGTARWNSQIDSFLNYIKNQPTYLNITRDMKKKSKLDKKTDTKLNEMLKILNDNDVFAEVESCVEILKPICIALDAVSLTREQNKLTQEQTLIMN